MKPNLDPENVLNRTLQIYGNEWEETDIPAYYRREQFIREQKLAELSEESRATSQEDVLDALERHIKK